MTANDPRFIAALDLLRRTGLRTFQLRFSDDDEPVVWMVVGEWSVDASGHPVPTGGSVHYEAAAAIDPVRAALRLCDTMLDGGVCKHCARPTGVTDDWRSDMPLAALICWYVYDPETQTFRRSCEGGSE